MYDMWTVTTTAAPRGTRRCRRGWSPGVGTFCESGCIRLTTPGMSQSCCGEVNCPELPTSSLGPVRAARYEGYGIAVITEVSDRRSTRCSGFLKGRLRFGDGEQSAPIPSALAVWGAGPETLAALDGP